MANSRRTEMLKVRMKPAEREALHRLAAAERLTQSELVRRWLADAQNGQGGLSTEDRRDLWDLSEQMRRVGINLNLVARNLQAVRQESHTQAPRAEEILELFETLTELRDGIATRLKGP